MPTRRAPGGFTLIELVIVVAVVAMLAAFAYPSYLGAVVKSRRAQAQVVLADVAQRQQQYLVDNRAFAASVTTLGAPIAPEVAAAYRFDITVGTGPAPGYTVTATPLEGSPQAVDGPLTLTSEGSKLPAGKW